MSKVLLMAAMALSAGCVGGLARSRYERNHFVVEETELVSEKILHPRTLVFLSDLHDKEFGKDNESLMASLKNIHPDAVLIGGDTMVTKPGKAKLEVTERFLQALTAICPVYYGNGNHEQRMRKERQTYGDRYKEFRRILRKYKVWYLSDASVEMDEDIRISGLDIDEAYYRDLLPPRMKEEYVEKHLGKADGTRFQILLAHSPLFFRAYRNWGADLSLCGHFHGGTIRLPLLGGVMTPQYQFFLPCCAGTFERKGRWMMVSRGLGTHSVNIRLRNRPQVLVIRLRPVR